MEYRDIKGYEGKYQVTDDGRVYSIKRKKFLNDWDSRGYRRVSLVFGGKNHYKFIHDLVAEAFIDNPENLPCVNHKDEDKANNTVGNLEWCDYKYNSNYGTCIERSAEKRRKPIAQYTLTGELVTTYPSLTEAANAIGTKPNHLGCYFSRHKKSMYGYIWRYAE